MTQVLKKLEIGLILVKKDDTWTILSFHQVENNPQKWGCTPEMFEKICEYIHQKNVKVLTVSESLKHFNVFA